MIVVDTNIIVYLFMEEDRSAQLEIILSADPEWVAPRLWRSEFRNALTLYMRRRQLVLEDAIAAMIAAEKVMHNGEYDVPSARVLAQAQLSSCSAYDCEFVVLAQDLGIRLVTVDKKILTAFPETAVSPEDYLRSANMYRR